MPLGFSWPALWVTCLWDLALPRGTRPFTHSFSPYGRRWLSPAVPKVLLKQDGVLGQSHPAVTG